MPVTDVDRAKAFYADQLGFVVDVDDSPMESIRVVQLTPPGSACSIMVGTGITRSEPGSLQGPQLVVDDIEAAREELAGRGVDVSPVQHFDEDGLVDGKGGPWNSFVFFSDPDGNGWVLQERPRRRRIGPDRLQVAVEPLLRSPDRIERVARVRAAHGLRAGRPPARPRCRSRRSR